MLLRRSLYYAQFPLAVILPTWVLVSRGILFDGIGAQLVVYLVVCPVLTIVMIVMATLIAARGSVRASKAISWRDVALQVAVWLTLFAYGLFAFSLLAVLAALLVIGGFWLVLVDFLREAKRWVASLFDLGPIGGTTAQQRATVEGPTSGPNVIVVPPESPPRPQA